MWDSSSSGTHGIPLDSPTCPTWDSRTGRTCGIQVLVVHVVFQWTVQSVPHGTDWTGWTCGIQARVVQVGFDRTVPSVPHGTVGWDEHVRFKL